MKKKCTNYKLRLLTLFFCLLLGIQLNAQNVTIVSVAAPLRTNVCGDGKDKDGNNSKVTVTAALATGTNGTFKVKLPVGFTYIAGSFGGASFTESDISNLNEPVFATTSTMFNQLSILITANCNYTASRIITATATSGGSSASSSIIANVDAPNVIQLSWTNDVINNAVVGQTYTRTVTIKNADIGYTKTFDFQSINGAGVQLISTSISSPVSILLTPIVSGDTSKFTVNGAVFPAGLLGNTYFEDQEEITITQTIKVLNCVGLTTSNKYRTVFGCLNTPICQETEHITVINLANGIPQLSQSIIEKVAPSLCTDGKFIYRVTNTGTESTPGAGFAKINKMEFRFVGAFAIPYPDYGYNGNFTFTQYAFRNGTDSAGSALISLPDILSINNSLFSSNWDGIGKGLEDLDGDGLFNDLAVGQTVDIIFIFKRTNINVTNCLFSEVYNIPRLGFLFNGQCGGAITKTATSEGNGQEIVNFRQEAMEASGPTDLNPGETGIYCFKPSYSTYGWKAGGTFVHKFIIPKSLVLDGSITSSGGAASMASTTVISGIGTTDTIVVVQTTLANHQFCIPLKLVCATNTPSILTIEDRLFFRMDADCIDELLECKARQTASHCPIPCSKAMTTLNATAERTTFGWTDATKSTKVTKNTLGVNINRAYPCDSILVTVKGLALINRTGDSYGADISWDNIFGNTALTFANGFFKVIRGGITTFCPATINTTSIVSGKVVTDVRFNPNACLGGLQANDSVQFYGKYTVNKGLFSSKVLLSGFRSFLFADSLNLGVDKQSCDNWGMDLTLSSPELSSGAFPSILTCGSNEILNGLMNTQIDQDDDFPNEYRPWYDIKKVEYFIPTNKIAVDSAKYKVYADVYNNYYTAPSTTPIVYGGASILSGFDSYTVTNPNNGTWIPKDRSFNWNCCVGSGVSLWVTPTCKTDITTLIYSKTTYELYSYNDWSDVACKEIIESAYTGQNYNFAKPILSVTGSSINASTKNYSFDFAISNTTFNEAKNVWIGFRNPSGKITKIDSLRNITDGITVALSNYGSADSAWTSNGYKNNIGGNNNFPGSLVKNFRVYIDGSSCSKDSIQVEIGWNCSSLPITPVLDECPNASNWFFTNVAAAGISLQAFGPSAAQDLCNAIDISANLRTNDLGHTYNDSIRAVLPTGLTFVTGSAEYEYPAGSGIWTPISPIVSSGVLSFSLGAAIGVNGLYGTADAIANNDKISIRFKTKADCNFASGSRVAFRGYAYSACNSLKTTTTQYTPTINIAGLPANFTNYVLSQTFDAATLCEVKTVRNASLTITNPTTTPTNNTREAIRVVLPIGASYIAASATNAGMCTAFLGNPTISTAATGDTLKWDMPAGIGQNGTMCVNYQINVADNCEQLDLNAYTQFSAPVSCTVGPYAPVNCSALNIITGADLKSQASPSRPAYNINAFTFTWDNTTPFNVRPFTVTGSFTNTNNIGLPAGENMYIDFYWDANCDGIGDTYITGSTHTVAGPLAANATTNYTANFITDISNHNGECIVAKIARASANTTGINCICSPTEIGNALTLANNYISFTANKLNDAKSILKLEMGSSKLGAVLIVERSTNGINFITIATLAGTVNRTYNYIDNNIVFNAKNYYRIKEVKPNGIVLYSEIRFVDFANNAELNVYPNPVKNNLNIVLGSNFYNKRINIQLIDAVGRVITNKQIQNASSTEVIDVHNFANGSYELVIRGIDGKIAHKKVVIIK